MIRIKISKRTSFKATKRLKNKARIRKKVDGTADRPRLAVFKSTKHIYLQLIDDSSSRTVLSVSSIKKSGTNQRKTDEAKAAGIQLGKLALEKNIKKIVFDRSGYVYHGRIKAVADGVREAGLIF